MPRISAEDLLTDLEENPPERPLLDGLLWPGAVTLLVAVASAGKTTLTHRLCRCIASGEPFLDIPTHYPRKSVNIDLESPPGAKLTLLKTIQPVDGWDTTPPGTTGEQGRQILEQSEGDGLIVVDNLQTCLPVKDENDNALGAAQMGYFRGIAARSKASILLTYNAGKPREDKGYNYRSPQMARGASTRPDMADVVLNLIEEEADQEEQPSTFRLYVAKSRFGNRGDWIRYKWSETRAFDYTVVNYRKPAEQGRAVKQKILAHLAPGPLKRSDLVAAISEVSPRSVDTALAELVGLHVIIQPEYGLYALSSG